MRMDTSRRRQSRNCQMMNTTVKNPLEKGKGEEKGTNDYGETTSVASQRTELTPRTMHSAKSSEIIAESEEETKKEGETSEEEEKGEETKERREESMQEEGKTGRGDSYLDDEEGKEGGALHLEPVETTTISESEEEASHQQKKIKRNRPDKETGPNEQKPIVRTRHLEIPERGSQPATP